jgi:hypothetical protein
MAKDLGNDTAPASGRGSDAGRLSQSPLPAVERFTVTQIL